MKVLIIDNETKHLRKLKGLLKKNKVSVVKYNKTGLLSINGFDLLIFSGGGHHHPIARYQKEHTKVMDLIRENNKPMLGICFGCQLIACAFGACLKSIGKKKTEVIEIKTINNDKIFKGISNFRVYSAHKWVIKKMPNCLVNLAESKNGIEIIKHKNRLIYGFQFHPEVLAEKTCGSKIFHNFLNLVKQNLFY